jgi:hypothetical protein
MAIQFQCSQCGVQFNVGQELAGTMARCNSCGNVVTVPAAQPAQPAPQKKLPPVVAPVAKNALQPASANAPLQPMLPVARIESPAPQSLPVARMEVAQPAANYTAPSSAPQPLTPLAPAPTASGIKRPVYQLPSQRPRAGGSSMGMWLAIGGGVAALLLLGVGIAGTIAVNKIWPKQVAAIPVDPGIRPEFPADTPAESTAPTTSLPGSLKLPASSSSSSPTTEPSSFSSSSGPAASTTSGTSSLPPLEKPASQPAVSNTAPPPAITTPPPSTTTSGGLPAIPARAKAAANVKETPGVPLESILPKADGDETASKTAKNEKPEPPRIERPWTAKVDPPDPPIEYKKGKISIQFPRYAEGIAANGPSNFLMLFNREGGNEVRAVIDLRSGNFIGKPVEGKLDISYNTDVFSADGRYFAARLSKISDTTIGVWSFATGKLEREFELANEYKDYEVAFAGTHKLATVVHRDFRTAEIAVRDIKTGKTIKDWTLTEESGERVARKSLLCSPGGKYLLFVMGKRLVVIDIASGEGVGEVLLEENPYDCEGMAFSPDGHLLALLYRAGNGPRLMVVEFPTGKVSLNHQYSSSLESFWYDGPVLDWVPDKSAIVYKGHLLIDPQSGEDFWTFPTTDKQPRRIIRQGDILVARKGNKASVYETVSIPAAEMTKALDLVRSGGTAVDTILPPVTTPDLFSATKVTLPNGFVQWSADPDAAPADAKKIDGEIMLAKENESLQSLMLTSGKGAKIVLQKEITPRAGTSGGKRDQKRVIIERIDLVTGAHSPPIDVPHFYRTVDVSPSGNFAVAGFSDRKTNVDRIDVIGLLPKKHIAGFRPYAGETEDPNAPKYDQSKRFQLKYVGLIDDEHVLTINALGKLVVWKLPDCKAVYYFDNFGDPLAASPNRKYLVGVHDGQFRIFDSRTGQCLGDLESPSCGVKPLRAAIRNDGRELVSIINAGEDRMLVRWNLLTGKIDQEFPIPRELIAGFVFRIFGEEISLEYRGQDHLLLDRKYLIDLKKRLVIWRYQADFGTRFVAGSPDSRTWYCMRKPNSNWGSPLFLTSVETPSPAVIRKSAGASLEKNLLLYPGRSVRLHIDLSALSLNHLQATVEKAVKESLEARGILVDASAPLMLSVVVGAGSTGDQIDVVSGSRSRFPWHRGTERVEQTLDQKIMTCRIALSDTSGVRWTQDNSVAMRSWGTVGQNAQAQLEKEMYDQFMSMLESGKAATSGVPTYIFYPLEESLPGESQLIFGGETSVAKNAPPAGGALPAAGFP